MPSRMNKKAKVSLKRMEKHGDMVYDGITPAAPHNIIDAYRAIEGADIKSEKERYYFDQIELSRRLLTIDNEYYFVSDDTAHRLIDYIEQSNFDVVDELQLEFSIKKKEVKSLYQELENLSKKDFISGEDFMRAKEHKRKNIKIYERKMDYVQLVIDTIKEFEDEMREEYEDNSMFPDFSFQFTNHNNSLDGAGKLK